jgi:uncharacterized membrane protein
MTLELAMVAAWWRQSNLLSIVLLLSLGANLFVAGWLVGGHSLHQGPPPPGGPMDRFGDEISSSLSADGAQIMEKAFDDVRRRFADHSATIKASRDRLTALMKAEPFSTADYIAASRETRTERDNDRTQADEVIVTAISRLSSDDRRRLADLSQHHRPDGGPPGFVR